MHVHEESVMPPHTCTLHSIKKCLLKDPVKEETMEKLMLTGIN